MNKTDIIVAMVACFMICGGVFAFLIQLGNHGF